jgi:hypothetical protein
MPNPGRFPATHKFSWPGNDVSYICSGHLPTLKNIARALGLFVAIEPLDETDFQLCRQEGSCPWPEEAALARREEKR